MRTSVEIVPKLIEFPNILVEVIDKCQIKNYINSFSGTIYELTQKVLKDSFNLPLDLNSSPPLPSECALHTLEEEDFFREIIKFADFAEFILPYLNINLAIISPPNPNVFLL